MAPYLWSKRPIENIQWYLNSIRYGVENLIAWFRIVWSDRDWDHDYLLRIMEFKFRRMAHGHAKHAVYVGREKCAQQLRICAHLCKRLREDEYGDDYEQATAKRNHDRKLLGKMLGRYIDIWWW